MKIFSSALLLSLGMAVSLGATASPAGSHYQLRIRPPNTGGSDATPFEIVYCGESNGAVCSQQLQDSFNGQLARVHYNSPASIVYLPKVDPATSLPVTVLTLGNDALGSEYQHYCRFTIDEDGGFSVDAGAKLKFTCTAHNYGRGTGADLSFHFAP